MSDVVVLDNEAVQAIADVRHRKHTLVVELLRTYEVGERARGGRARVVLPAAVRVEAGLERSARSYHLDVFAPRDTPLVGATADVAARLVAEGIATSVADAHVGASIAGCSPDETVVVLSSDPSDMRRVAGGRRVNVVTV